MGERYSMRSGSGCSRASERRIPAELSQMPTNCPRASVEGQNACGDCNAWRHRLQILDFALTDLVLYLDAYPTCAEALAYYNTLLEERDALLSAMPKKDACAMTNLHRQGGDTWTWTRDPWPWHPEANE